MPLDPITANEMRAASLDAAAAFLEDFDRGRRVIAKGVPNREDARWLGGILRRLLVENDLVTVASPRIGRIKIIATNFTNAYVEAASKKILAFYAFDCYGDRASPLYATHANGNSNCPISIMDKKECFSDDFRDQLIVFFDNAWVPRRDLIKYIANEKSGVHSAQYRGDHKLTISRLAASVSSSQENEKRRITMVNPPMFIPASTYKHDKLNPVLATMYITASELFYSPDVERLAKLVRAELSLYT